MSLIGQVVPRRQRDFLWVVETDLDLIKLLFALTDLTSGGGIEVVEHHEAYWARSSNITERKSALISLPPTSNNVLVRLNRRSGEVER